MKTAKAPKSMATKAPKRISISDVEDNPLAEKLSTRHAETLDRLHDLLGDLFEITEPHGKGCEDFSWRRATNREAAQAGMQSLAGNLEIDLRGDVPAQVVTKLRQFARDVLARARRVEMAAKRGVFSKKVKGHFVTKGGKVIYGPCGDCRAHNIAMQAEGTAVRRFTDGTETVLRDYETAAAE